MALEVRKLLLCCSVPTFLLFFLTFSLTVAAGLEWNELTIPGPRPNSGDRFVSHERSVREFAVELDKVHNVTAHARIIHRCVKSPS